MPKDKEVHAPEIAKNKADEDKKAVLKEAGSTEKKRNLYDAQIGDILKCKICGFENEYNEKNVGLLQDHLSAHPDKHPNQVFEQK